jgi:putative endonuclease
MCYHVYILHSESLDIYYHGQTEDLEDRLNRHNHGYEKSTCKGLPWKLVWSAKKESRSEAMKLERMIKNLSRERLIKFIEKYK